MNSTQFARLKNTTPVFLKLPKGVQRCRQFLIRCRHCSPNGQLHVYNAAPVQVYYDARKQVQHAAPTHVNVEQETRRNQHTCAPIRTDLDCSGSSFARQPRSSQESSRLQIEGRTMPKLCLNSQKWASQDRVEPHRREAQTIVNKGKQEACFFTDRDSKSAGGNSMGVQLPLPAPSCLHLSHFLLLTYVGVQCAAE